MAATLPRSSNEKDVPLPYRVLNKDYMAQQLPHLEEKAPPIIKTPLDFKTNAPSSLPVPSLFPGEVLRMKQHRVVCVDSFDEPAVGVIYLTNFRIIFNGNPITDPDMYEVLYELQSYSISSKNRETLLPTPSIGNMTTMSRTLGWRKKPSLAPPPTPPRVSRFYIGTREGEGEGGGEEEGEEGDGIIEDEGKQAKLSSKLFQRLNTIRRSTGAGIKNAFGDISADIAKLKPNKATPTNAVNLKIPEQQTDILSTSAPNKPSTLLTIDTPPKQATMPRNMPSSIADDETTPTTQLYTVDSGIVDPPSEATPPSGSLTTPPNEYPPTSPLSGDIPVFIDDKIIVGDDIDFERSPMDFPLHDSRRTCPNPLYPRLSLVAPDSDSDSDTATDRYFGSITEDDLTSPEPTSPPPSVPSPRRSSSHTYMNVTLKKRVDTSSSIASIESSIESSNMKITTPATINEAPPTDLTPPVDSFNKVTLPADDSKPAPPNKPPRRKKISKTNSDKKEEINISENKDKEEKGEEKGKKEVLSQQQTFSYAEAKQKELNNNSNNWKRSHSDGITKRVGSERRRPPPPPPSKTKSLIVPTIATPINSPTTPTNLMTTPTNSATPTNFPATPVSHTTVTKSSSDPNLLASSPPFPCDPFLSSGLDDRNSSLVANRGSSAHSTYMRRLTISSPREPSYSFDWTNRSYGGDASSLPTTFSNSATYYQYSYSVSLPLATVHSIKHISPTQHDGSGLRMPDGLLILGKNFSSLKLHIHPANTFDALKLKELFELIINEDKPVFKSFAFIYRSAIKLHNPHVLDSRKLPNFFHFDTEMERIGILNSKIENSQLWRVTTITKTNPELCPSYPEKLVVLLCTPDVDLLRGGDIYEEGRFPTACWMNKSNHSVLLRAAATTAERGLQSSKLPVDEAILQAIRRCNTHSRLFVFTEKSDNAGFHDPNKLTKEAARSYYYHNCNFVYSVNPPTYKSVRHSFNKLQAMLQNNIGDYEYLMALDNTRWLSRIGDLLATTHKVIEALEEDSAHVLVCYEKGWDRTTQIVSLTQLLCDPYYRTMDGFQVLIQKEWLWFGHPFQLRHNRQSSKVKEDGPVFMQWIDCVWQMTRQCPFSFEFNENMLIAIVEHAYSNQFGTFLANSEKERAQCFMIPDHYHQSVYANTVSFWTWVAMVNASNNIFYNKYYNPSFHTGVIYPKYYQTCLEVWRSHYDRHKLRQESQEGLVINNRLHTELHQLLRLYWERHQPDQNLSLNLGLDSSLLKPVSLSPLFNGDDEQLGPNPLLPSSSATAVTSAGPRGKSMRQFSSIQEFLNEEGYDPSVCHHIVLSSSKCQGYLVKEGGFRKNWKKRWFVLDYTTEYMAYFESQEHYDRKERPKGVITLEDIKKVSLSTRRYHLMSNLFQIKTPIRTYNIKAPSIISMEIWMACLKLPPFSINIPPS